ncbi:hypothetical protein AHIS1636_27560 [Arthrobacter mangrovi]|uniref:Uncharacterized protein n=1 Tax=Arthrobacter mangrovi TaxID=2966350 RepID=A0ABQ5MWH2_9MICC|nr:hypothetical protein AHIS1636_27560 [Arthrobacter mangrovi]
MGGQLRPGPVPALPVLDCEAVVAEGGQQTVCGRGDNVEHCGGIFDAEDLTVAQGHEQPQRAMHGIERRHLFNISHGRILAPPVALGETDL